MPFTRIPTAILSRLRLGTNSRSSPSLINRVRPSASPPHLSVRLLVAGDMNVWGTGVMSSSEFQRHRPLLQVRFFGGGSIGIPCDKINMLIPFIVCGTWSYSSVHRHGGWTMNDVVQVGQLEYSDRFLLACTASTKFPDRIHETRYLVHKQTACHAVRPRPYRAVRTLRHGADR